MKRASVSEAKNSLSALLARVRSGGSVVIEDRGVPVARLEALGAAADGEGRVARLVRAGILRAPRAAAPEAVLRSRPPRARPGTTASAALIEERRGGR
jgi:antitoxin (DNA-binding transcriptional repressor) of toxin-antitoxin stability system